MDLLSIVFGALIMLEAVLVLDGIGLWKDGDYKAAAMNWVLGLHLWLAFFVHTQYGFHTTTGMLLLTAVTVVYYAVYKCLQPSKS